MQIERSSVGTDRQDSGETQAARDLLDRIRAEYREMPGLCLSQPQAARLWGLSAQRCADVLDVLIAEGDLTCTRDGRYVATPNLLTPRRHVRVGSGHRRGAA